MIPLTLKIDTSHLYLIQNLGFIKKNNFLIISHIHIMPNTSRYNNITLFSILLITEVVNLDFVDG
jgi:hypothetical protein